MTAIYRIVIMMEKHSRYTLLLDLYGELLTEKQRSLIDQYYNYDLSMQEIAENEGISKQAVYDSLKRSEQSLMKTEEKLKLLERHLAMEEDFKSLYKKLDAICQEKTKEASITSLCDIKDELKLLINKYTGG